MKQLLQSYVNVKLSFLRKSFGKSQFKLLDVGAGNHSVQKIKSVFPNCIYYGLDIDKNYNNNSIDFQLMKGFYEIDLTKLDYTAVPDNFFDAICMAHVIEHLHNGDAVLPLLVKKLRPGGYFYIEYPGKKSTTLPSMRGTLNFYDDASHVRVYSVAELKQVFEAAGCTVLQSGTRRNIAYIAALPFRAAASLLSKGYVEGNVFWDLLGFAEYLRVKRIA